ncbi:MAG: hypothetical protein AAGI46_00670 [Planctomycetota bacterium]
MPSTEIVPLERRDHLEIRLASRLILVGHAASLVCVGGSLMVVAGNGYLLGSDLFGSPLLLTAAFLIALASHGWAGRLIGACVARWRLQPLRVAWNEVLAAVGLVLLSVSTLFFTDRFGRIGMPIIFLIWAGFLLLTVSAGRLATFHRNLSVVSQATKAGAFHFGGRHQPRGGFLTLAYAKVAVDGGLTGCIAGAGIGAIGGCFESFTLLLLYGALFMLGAYGLLWIITLPGYILFSLDAHTVFKRGAGTSVSMFKAAPQRPRRRGGV